MDIFGVDALDLVESENHTFINLSDRRNKTRYSFIDAAFSMPLSIDHKVIEDYSIINFSLDGIALEIQGELPSNIEFPLKIKLPIDATIKCNSRIIWSYQKGKSHYYGLQLYFFPEEKNFQLYYNFVKQLSKISNVEDRRETVKTMVQHKEDERRQHKSFFIKSLKNSRLKALQEQGQNYYLRERNTTHSVPKSKSTTPLLNFASNNFLGISNHPTLIEASIKALEKYGTFPGGTRYIENTTDIREEVESRLANFIGKEECILFPNGYLANLGVISSIVTEGDHAFLDSHIHGSILDGGALSNCKMSIYRHNDMASLERLIKKNQNDTSKIIMTEGIFGMDGDISRLDIIHQLAQEYNSAVLVDDSHAIGVLGKTGRGSTEYFKLDSKIDIITGSLTKALGCHAGFAAGSRKVINFIRQNSRALIFSSGISPMVSASIIASLDIIEKEPELVQRLWQNTIIVKQKLLEAGFELGLTESPIIPIKVKNENKVHEFNQMLLDKGIYAIPLVYPAVKKNESRMRVSIMASHTIKDLEYLVETLKSTAKLIDIIR